MISSREVQPLVQATPWLVCASLLALNACQESQVSSEDDVMGAKDGWGGQNDTTNVSAPDAHDLISQQELMTTIRSLDPLDLHRPEEILCNDLVGWYLEGRDLEINTGKCNYLSLSAPATISARKGEWLVADLSFFDLTSPEPAEAHFALTAGSEILWEKRIAIPSPGDVIHISTRLEFSIEKGIPIGVHLHNHGQNTWKLSPLVITPTL